jgi:hypothetical protein
MYILEQQTFVYFSYSFFTLIGCCIALVQAAYLCCCRGCCTDKARIRMLSYTCDLSWAIIKEVPQMMIISRIYFCRDGWFQISSLFKAIFSIAVTIWKFYNMYTFLSDDARSEGAPKCCRENHLYLCYPTLLIPIWLGNLGLAITIAALFFLRHQGERYFPILNSPHRLYVHDEYLYTKYIIRSGIYLRWPDDNYENSYIKLADIDYIMANKQTTVNLLFNLPYVCFERSLSVRTPYHCFRFHSETKNFSVVSFNEFNQYRTNQNPDHATFIFYYRTPSNKYNLGQIKYLGNLTLQTLYLDKLLYFRLNQIHTHRDDFLYKNPMNSYQLYDVNQTLIPIVEAWKLGLAKCRPCLLGPQPQLSTN